jgi:hypothetical protein
MTTTLGAAESLADDVVITRELTASVGEVPSEQLRTFRRNAERDLDLTHARWPRTRPVVGPFVAGDAIRLRGLAARTILRRLNDDNADPQHKQRSMQVLAVLRSAVVYWLPGSTAHGMTQTAIAADDLVELRMPHNHVLICFGSPFTLDVAWRGGEDEISRRRSYDVSLEEAVAGHPTRPDQLPAFTRHPTIALYRGNHVELLGVLVTARDNGQPRDLLLSLVRIVREDGTESITLSEGRFTTARIAPLVWRWMTVVAWGQWTSPARDLLPSDPRSKQFRRAIRDPATRTLEVSGQAGGVRVLDAPRMHALAADPTPNTAPVGTHASPLPHWRRGHVQRYRIGPRDNWTYEQREKQRQLVNWEGDLTNPPPTVYRLPPPP